MQEMYMFNSATLSGLYNLKEQNGVQYVIVPVTMIVEGVLNNAFYSKEELSRNVNQWNGKPLPLGHPTDEQGKFIMANTPDIIEKHSVGQIWNTKFIVEDGVGKLKAEAWINIDKASKLAPKLIKQIEANEKIEVSTGLFTDAVLNPGKFNGKSYDWVVSNFRPDHLAILIDEKGACSINDGCGLNNNKDNMINRLKEKVKNIISTNNSHNELRNKVESALIQYLELSNNSYVSIVDVYDDKFIYQTWSDGKDPEMYQVNFSLNNENQIDLQRNHIKVKMEKNFVSVEADDNAIKFNSNQNKNKTPKKGESQMDELVNKLINNSATGFNESDREYLMSLDEDRLKAFTPQVTNNESDKSDEDCNDCGENKSDVSTNQEAKDDDELTANAKVITELVKSFNDLKKELPSMIANAVEEKREEDAKAPIIKKLKANGCKISDKALSAMSVEDLSELTANYGQPQKQYFGMAVPESPIGNKGANEVPKMPSLFETNENK